jgi:hypothetical protein
MKRDAITGEISSSYLDGQSLSPPISEEENEARFKALEIKHGCFIKKPAEVAPQSSAIPRPTEVVPRPEAIPQPAETAAQSTATLQPAIFHEWMRCEAKLPCPESGYWYTMAKPNSRAFFNKGAAMPDYPSSSYGATIWYWDEDQS